MICNHSWIESKKGTTQFANNQIMFTVHEVYCPNCGILKSVPFFKDGKRTERQTKYPLD